ncbi:hypothetical protein BDZ94DRAFT_895169 [Collybia nuda]|uniref:Uncharacterized protein n=1 Tax=Collybia nuda TaxID=64659 RepID=A0A9P5Y1I2_9AGAR|nr:hypothetical protein BDZ94DRAFT_895169 [Collybia nuda]
MSTNPEAAYPTPASPQRPRGSFQISASPPSSPSPLSRQPTLQYQNDTGMNVENGKIIGEPSQTSFDEPTAGSWGFGRYLRNLANILSSSVGSHKYPGTYNQALGRELQDKVVVESVIHHELAISLNDCQKSLETANATIVTKEEQLRVMQEKFQAALRTKEALQAEVTIIRNKLFHSELGRKALLARVAKLEKKLHKMDIYHDEEIQLWVTRVDELKQQISVDEIKARVLAEDWKRREAELQEVEKRQLDFQEYQESFDQMFDIMQRKRHLWPSQISPK